MGWLGTALTLIGCVIVGHKSKTGFLLQGSGNLCWLIVGIQKEMPDLVFVSACFVVVYVFNYRKWQKSDRIKQKRARILR
jgi:hypothetical protein